MFWQIFKLFDINYHNPFNIKYNPILHSTIHSLFSNSKKDTAKVYKWYVGFFLFKLFGAVLLFSRQIQMSNDIELHSLNILRMKRKYEIEF